MGNLAFDLYCEADDPDNYSPFDDDGDIIELGEHDQYAVDLNCIESCLNSDKREVIYFIKVAPDLVKIGSAANVNNFKQRLSECARWVENPIVLGLAFCDRRVEKLIHNACTDYHVKTKGREIFRLEHELKVSIGKWSEWSIYGSKFGNTQFSDIECELEDFLKNPFKFYCELEGIDVDDLVEDEDDYGKRILTVK